MRPTTSAEPVIISGAGNEWLSFCLQVNGLVGSELAKPAELRLGPLVSNGANGVGGESISPSNMSACWVVPVAIDTHQASLVRQAGPAAMRSTWPAALLPVPMNSGIASLHPPRSLVSPTLPADTGANADWLWIDLHIPPNATAGDYQGTCQLVWGGNVIQSLAVKLKVYDFALSDVPGLVMSGRIDWSDLPRLFPDRFDSLIPQWLSRSEPRYDQAVQLLDDLQSLAQANRLQIVVPRLGPIAKWSPGQPPQLDWSSFDDLVRPWLGTTGPAAKMPVRYWPLPTIDALDQPDQPGRRQFTAAALAHFDQQQWLENAVVEPDPIAAGQGGDADLCRAAAAVLAMNPRARVMVPIDKSRLLFRTADGATLLDPSAAERIVSAGQGLIGSRHDPATTESTSMPLAPTSAPAGMPIHQWLLAGAGAESLLAGGRSNAADARLWAALAYLRQAELVRFDQCLPATNDAGIPADPDALPWFYPGSWFGVDKPVASIRAKWLRRAEQDYEYLTIADGRGISATAGLLARLLAKPVELTKDQSPDATYGLVCGTVDSATWQQAREFLAADIELHRPFFGGPPAAQQALDVDLSRWEAEHQRPYIIPRGVQWRPGADGEFDADIALDIYNASDALAGRNLLQWDRAPKPWELPQEPLAIGSLDAYAVQCFNLTAKVSTRDLPAAAGAAQIPMTVSFVNAYTRFRTPRSLVIPVGHCDRRAMAPRIDGQLEDWNMADAIQDGPMIRLLDRPAVQSGDLPVAPRASQICTNWTSDEFLVAFKLQDVDTTDVAPIRNFVQYDQRRAWGEDLCELLVQAQWPDGSTSPAVHIVAKPRGAVWVERQSDAPSTVDNWKPIDAAVRYAATLHTGDWRGELAVPWALLCPNHKDTPIALRFNFVQHAGGSGESDSWSGPIDFGRDERFMGLLVLRGLDAAAIPSDGQPRQASSSSPIPGQG